MAERQDERAGWAWGAQLRAVAAVAAAASAAWGMYAFQVANHESSGWQLLLVALLLGLAAQTGLVYPAPPPGPPPQPTTAGRVWLGAALALAGVALWTTATWRLYHGWEANFDFAWV